MTHRKKDHEENIKNCKLFKKGNCTYHESCWFAHKKEEIDEKIIIKTNKEQKIM